MTCAEFDDSVAELALGLLDADEADALLAHAAGCAQCRDQLDALSQVADRTATVAPEAEPPLGFEQRAIAAMVGRRRSPVWRVALAAAVVLLVAIAAAGLAWKYGSDDRVRALDRVGLHTVTSGQFLDTGGRVRGSAVLIAGGEPGRVRTTLTMTLRHVEPGTYHCTVRTTDGRMVEVASWPITTKGAGTWAVPLRGDTRSASAVVITEDGGSEVATADLR